MSLLGMLTKIFQQTRSHVPKHSTPMCPAPLFKNQKTVPALGSWCRCASRCAVPPRPQSCQTWICYSQWPIPEIEVLYHRKPIFLGGHIPLRRPYIDLIYGSIYGRYLQFKFLKWSLIFRGYKQYSITDIPDRFAHNWFRFHSVWGPRLQNHRLTKAKPKLAEIKYVQTNVANPMINHPWP